MGELKKPLQVSDDLAPAYPDIIPAGENSQGDETTKQEQRDRSQNGGKLNIGKETRHIALPNPPTLRSS